MTEGDGLCLVVHAFDDGDGLYLITGITKLLPAFLQAFLNGDTNAGDGATCLVDDVDESTGCFAVGEEVIDDEHLVVGREIRTGHEDVVHLLVGEGISLRDVLVVSTIGSFSFLGEDYGYIIEIGEHSGNGDARCFDGEDFVDGFATKTTLELVSNLAHDVDVNLVIEEIIDLEDIARINLAVFEYLLFEKIHKSCCRYRLESPLGCNGGVDEESVVATGTPNEVVAYLPLGTDAELLLRVLLVQHVDPKLRFGKEDKALLVVVGLVTVPQISKTTECAPTVGELDAPYTCELETGHGIECTIGRVSTLEVLLVESLQSPGLAEVLAVPAPCGTYENSLLEGAALVDTAIILEMGGETVGGILHFGESKVASCFPVSTDDTTVEDGCIFVVVEIDEEECRTELVGIEELCCGGKRLTICLTAVDGGTEVVVGLDVELCAGAKACHYSKSREKKLFHNECVCVVFLIIIV